jgi:hypothetical protein
VALIGGDSHPEYLAAHDAQKFGADLVARAKLRNMNLFVISSPRTSLAVDEILRTAVSGVGEYHAWRSAEKDAYANLLALGDEFIVTSDSVSMAVDALNQSKPVLVYKLREEWNLPARIVEWFWHRKAFWFLFSMGLLQARPDRTALLANMMKRYAIAKFTISGDPPKGEPISASAPAAVRRIRELMAAGN